VQSFEFSRSIHAFWNNVAQGEARGWHPRWLHNEQSVWTPFGTSSGVHCALMNEDGMVEVDQGSFSIEPMIWTPGRLFTWTDLASRQELLAEWMPVPSVVWETADWRLRMQAESTLSGSSRVHYRFENLTDREFSARLFVLLRPFQVTPPWQSFRNLGGVSRIHDLAWRDGAVLVNESHLIVPSIAAGAAAPKGFGALRFDEGFMTAHLASGVLPANADTHDSFGFATGRSVLSCRPELMGWRKSFLSCQPAAAASSIAEPAFEWSTSSMGPMDRQWLDDGRRTRGAHGDGAHSGDPRGPALQPGPRRYTRSWIRDGAMMSAALLRMGHAQEVREFHPLVCAASARRRLRALLRRH